jgi:hypothetical protein
MIAHLLLSGVLTCLHCVIAESYVPPSQPHGAALAWVKPAEEPVDRMG